ncbi:MAG: TolC family protein [Bacteroidia bacterium]|nr:TolC family protein [Bacteroidia bacterium]
MRIILLTSLCISTMLLQAQPGAPRALSLAEAMDLAEAQRPSLEALRINVAVAQEQQTRAALAWRPSVTLSGDFRLNTQLQTNILPGEFLNRAEDVAIRFGTRFSTLAGVEVEQPLYNPAIRADRQLAANQTLSDELALGKASADVRLGAGEAYYDLVFRQESYRLSEAAAVRARQLLQEGEESFRSGNLLPAELERLRLDLRNAETSLRNDARSLSRSRAYLLAQLGLPASEALALTDSLPGLLNGYRPADTLADPASGRIELRQEQARLARHELTYEKYRRSNLPVVSLYGNLSLQQLTNDAPLFDADSWFSFSYVGVRASVPLYNAVRRSQLREYELRMAGSRSSMSQLELDIRSEWTAAQADWRNARETLLQSRENLRVAHQLLDADRVRFQQGQATFATVSNAVYALQQARNTLMESIYNFLVADLRLRKAGGMR